MGRQITRHFNEDELRCKCGCGKMLFTDRAVGYLEDLRVAVGFPLPVSSGYRCPSHNDRVSSTGAFGPHTVYSDDNVTVDLRVLGGSALEVLRQALALGFTGVGVSQKGPRGTRFVHLDRLPVGGRHPRSWLWSY